MNEFIHYNTGTSLLPPQPQCKLWRLDKNDGSRAQKE